jgi:hypothetical protein
VLKPNLSKDLISLQKASCAQTKPEQGPDLAAKSFTEPSRHTFKKFFLPL